MKTRLGFQILLLLTLGSTPLVARAETYPGEDEWEKFRQAEQEKLRGCEAQYPKDKRYDGNRERCNKTFQSRVQAERLKYIRGLSDTEVRRLLEIIRSKPGTSRSNHLQWTSFELLRNHHLKENSGAPSSLVGLIMRPEVPNYVVRSVRPYINDFPGAMLVSFELWQFVGVPSGRQGAQSHVQLKVSGFLIVRDIKTPAEFDVQKTVVYEAVIGTVESTSGGTITTEGGSSAGGRDRK